MVFAGYHNLPDATAAAFTPDRYFLTGDLSRLDDDGFLLITRRLKDLIIVSGEKAHPREIEEVLARHPAIAEVAVIGRRDDSRGEVPVALVVLQRASSPSTPTPSAPIAATKTSSLGNTPARSCC